MGLGKEVKDWVVLFFKAILLIVLIVAIIGAIILVGSILITLLS